MKLLYLILFASTLIACEKNDVYTQSCSKSLEEAAGLSIVTAEIEQYSCQTNINAGTLNGQSVYITTVVDPLCQTNGTVGVYNCKGEFLDNIKPDYQLIIGDVLSSNTKNLQ